MVIIFVLSCCTSYKNNIYTYINIYISFVSLRDLLSYSFVLAQNVVNKNNKKCILLISEVTYDTFLFNVNQHLQSKTVKVRFLHLF